MNISVVVPVKNEVDNIKFLLEDFEACGLQGEIIFIEGGSIDGTWGELLRQKEQSNLRIICLQQTNGRKGEGVWMGVRKASGEVILVLDCDRTIDTFDAVRVAAIAAERSCICIADRLSLGSRSAMPLANRLYNHFMSLLFGFIFEQRCIDLFAGCKAFPADRKIALEKHRYYFSIRDEWSDLEMLSASALLGISIVNYPVKYSKRKYGSSKIMKITDGGNLFMFFIECAVAKRFHG